MSSCSVKNTRLNGHDVVTIAITTASAISAVNIMNNDIPLSCKLMRGMMVLLSGGLLTFDGHDDDTVDGKRGDLPGRNH